MLSHSLSCGLFCPLSPFSYVAKLSVSLVRVHRESHLIKRIYTKVWMMGCEVFLSEEVLLKVLSWNQQQPLGVCEKCRFSGPVQEWIRIWGGVAAICVSTSFPDDLCASSSLSNTFRLRKGGWVKGSEAPWQNCRQCDIFSDREAFWSLLLYLIDVNIYWTFTMFQALLSVLFI